MKSLPILAKYFIPSAILMASLSLGLSAQAHAQGGLPAEVIKVKTQELNSYLEAVGSLKANQSVVLSPELSGRLEKIGFEDGATVKQGQVLFALNDASHKAQLQEAQARVRLSQVEFKRINKLFKQGAASETDLDSAKANLNINQAQADYTRAQLEKLSIKAPFDGVIGIHNLSTGDYLTTGEALVELVDLGTLNFDFYLPETYLSQVKVGQTIEIKTSAFPQRSFNGSVIAIAPKIEEKGRSLLVRAQVANPDQILRPGLFASVKLLVKSQQNALLLPEQALIPQGNQYFVMTVMDNAVAQVPVTIGQRQGALVEITSGVKADDVVITAGQLKLQHGAPVTPLFPPSEEATAAAQ